MAIQLAAGYRGYRDLLVTYLRPQRGRVALLAMLLLGDITLQLVNPQILRFFIDTARRGGSPSWSSLRSSPAWPRI